MLTLKITVRGKARNFFSSNRGVTFHAAARSKRCLTTEDVADIVRRSAAPTGPAWIDLVPRPARPLLGRIH